MDLGQIGMLITDNWGTITTVGLAVGGAYAVKVKKAVNSVIAAVEELQQTRDVILAALADKEITAAEAEEIGKELQEDLVQLQAAAQNVMAIIPQRFRKKIPVEFA